MLMGQGTRVEVSLLEVIIEGKIKRGIVVPYVKWSEDYNKLLLKEKARILWQSIFVIHVNNQFWNFNKQRLITIKWGKKSRSRHGLEFFHYNSLYKEQSELPVINYHLKNHTLMNTSYIHSTFNTYTFCP